MLDLVFNLSRTRSLCHRRLCLTGRRSSPSIIDSIHAVVNPRLNCRSIFSPSTRLPPNILFTPLSMYPRRRSSPLACRCRSYLQPVAVSIDKTTCSCLTHALERNMQNLWKNLWVLLSKTMDRKFLYKSVMFEDFANHNAFDLLEKYSKTHLVFNDDIKGIASVILAGVVVVLKFVGGNLSYHTFMFLGAGENKLLESICNSFKQFRVIAWLHGLVVGELQVNNGIDFVLW